MKLTARRAFVTGADRGLGLGFARSLLKRGFTVYAGTYMDHWHEFELLKEEFPSGLVPVSLDVSSMDSVRAAFQTTADHTDSIDLLINNAGILTDDGDIRQGLDLSKAAAAFGVNSLGPMRMVQTFLPLMQSGMKRLCFVSSEAGSISVCMRDRGPFTYCMSKTALNMAVRMTADALMPRGFTFRLYHPGWLKTWMEGEKNLRATVEAEDSAEAGIDYFLKDLDVEARLEVVDNQGVVWPF
ncbi:MAG: SDR family NAD(P)-dependent oxidoreductase [Spirochaetales bacterium]|nr:SDR family NAD(P)-dependent oxidoreductase [Spirochaetales bacterium]